MAQHQEARNIVTLCRKAFDCDEQGSESCQAALKTIANTLLLQEETRQIFAESGYASRVADRLRVKGEDRQEEMICSRILFLLTYDTTFNFTSLFDHHALAESIQANIAYHALRYSGQDLREDELDSDTPIYWLRSVDTRALCETLKLLFNLSQFYPDRKPSFGKTLPDILTILYHTHLEPTSLQPPTNYLVNALLNLDLPGSLATKAGDESVDSEPLFPHSNPSCHIQRLIRILDLAVQNYKVSELETAIPLLTLLRRINEIAPQRVQKDMRLELLPLDSERDQPLGSSETLASRLLKLSTNPVASNLKDGISSLLFELSSKNPSMFVRNVGYGYAAGYLMTHNIAVPEGLGTDVGERITSVDGQEVNPITGQRRDMEPPDPGLDMTDEEKEREAERLFVLFERLKATGVMNVTNPVEQAARQGYLEEVD